MPCRTGMCMSEIHSPHVLRRRRTREGGYSVEGIYYITTLRLFKAPGKNPDAGVDIIISYIQRRQETDNIAAGGEH